MTGIYSNTVDSFPGVDIILTIFAIGANLVYLSLWIKIYFYHAKLASKKPSYVNAEKGNIKKDKRIPKSISILKIKEIKSFVN